MLASKHSQSQQTAVSKSEHGQWSPEQENQPQRCPRKQNAMLIMDFQGVHGHPCLLQIPSSKWTYSLSLSLIYIHICIYIYIYMQIQIWKSHHSSFFHHVPSFFRMVSIFFWSRADSDTRKMWFGNWDDRWFRNCDSETLLDRARFSKHASNESMHGKNADLGSWQEPLER